MSLRYPESCKANHLNLHLPAEPTLAYNPTLFARCQVHQLTDFEKGGLERLNWFLTYSSAYSALQTTRPQNIGYSFADSPVGLLGWMYEKFVLWTDNYPWTDDEILTWISIYYFSTAGPAAPQRIYFEGQIGLPSSPDSQWQRAGEHIEGSKLGVSRFPKELAGLPKLWTEGMGDLLFDAEHDSGGHFAAWEKPEVLVDDVRGMFGKGGKRVRPT